MSTINSLGSQESTFTAITSSSESLFPRKISEIDFNKITNAIMNQFALTNEGANHLALHLTASQDHISENTAQLIEETDAIPHQLVVSRNAIFPIKYENLIGRGSYSKVYKVSMIATYPHQLGDTQLKAGEIAIIALKISSNYNTTPSYSPEKKMLQNFLTPQKRGIDNHLITFKIPSFTAYSVHQLFDASIDKFQFDKCRVPIKTMLFVLISAIQGLSALHNKNGVHKDIKGGNILALVREDEIVKGAITDWSFLAYKDNKIHRTIGTPEYLDPEMFGSPQDTLLNQKKRLGLQTKEGDIFALGITIIIDVLFQFITNISEKSNNKKNIHQIIEEIRPKSIFGPFTNEKLKEYGETYPYRVMYRHATSLQEEKIILYPPLEEVKNSLMRACNLLKDCLNTTEITALSLLSTLSCKMQEPVILRPNIHEIKENLTNIHKSLERKEQWESLDDNCSPNKKQKLEIQSNNLATPFQALKVDPKIVKSLSELIFASEIEEKAIMLIKLQQEIKDGEIKLIFIRKWLSLYITNTEIHIPNKFLNSTPSAVDCACSSIPTISHQLGNIQCSIGDIIKSTFRVYKPKKTKLPNVKNDIEIDTKRKKLGIEDIIIIYKDHKEIEYAFINPARLH